MRLAAINHRPSRNRTFQCIAMTAMAMQARADRNDRVMTFDADSSPIGVDNRCSACISSNVNDFIGPLTETNRAIKGIGGFRVTPVLQGTIQWQ